MCYNTKAFLKCIENQNRSVYPMIKTTDHIEKATINFFEKLRLNELAADYFASKFVQSKLDEGHKAYMLIWDAAKEDAPEGAEEFIEKVMPKYELTREAYEQDAFETFKEKFCEVFMAASLYISIEDKLTELLKRHDDANLIMLVESAMEDISEFMTVRFSNVVSLLMEGMPQELAEKIAEDAGDAVIAPIGISFGIDDDDEEDDCGCDCESECNGECGGRCSCEGKDECDDGHCCIKDSND